MKRKISLISLGCEKNLVDSEMILGLFKDGYEIVNNLNKADVIVINTCGFIKSAKEEALDTIFDCLDYKKNGTKIVVCGCLVQRYEDDLTNNELLKDVDLWIPIKDYYKFGDLINSLFEDKNLSSTGLDFEKRLISTGKALAYLKISEGCNNRCAYCAIPLIRGNFKSRSHEEIKKEFLGLVGKGYKEICLISQDLSNYGYDINDTLANLIKDLDSVEGDYAIRLLYLYPDEITDEFILAVKNSKHILHYFDIPLQHASNKLLKLMNRRGTKEDAKALISKIRSEMSDAIIRTTIIVGFPHESEKDFNELLEFIHEVKFNHLGAFTYSKEDDTTSFNMTMQVPKKVKNERYNKLMEEQRWVSLELNKAFLNKEMKCLIEKYDEDENVYLARTYIQAPDDIDGYVKISSDKKLELEEVYNCRIVDVDFYDMVAIII